MCCEEIISTSDVLYEIECPERSQPLQMHLQCLEAWELECRMRSSGPERRLAG